MKVILLYINLTTIFITSSYQLGATSATDLNPDNDVIGKKGIRSIKTTTNSVNNIVPIRILIDSNESNKAPVMNRIDQSTNGTHADTDNNSNIEIEFLMEIEPTDSPFGIDYGNDVNVIEERSGFVNTDTEESETFDYSNHETNDTDYEEDNHKDIPEEEYFLNNNKTDDDMFPSRRTLNYHGDLYVKARSGIPEKITPEASKWSSPFLPTFAGGYASNLPKLNENENTFHSVMAPQYYSVNHPAPRIFYTSPIYPRFLPIPTQIKKIDSKEIIIPNVIRYTEPFRERSTVHSVEETLKDTDNEFTLDNPDSNSYPYKPQPSLNTNSNIEDVPETNLVLNKIVESSVNPKQFNEGERSHYVVNQHIPIQEKHIRIQERFQRHHMRYISPYG